MVMENVNVLSWLRKQIETADTDLVEVPPIVKTNFGSS